MAFDPKKLEALKYDEGTEERPTPPTSKPKRTAEFDPERLKAIKPEAGSGVTPMQTGQRVVDGESAGTSMGKDALRFGIPLGVDLAMQVGTRGMGPLARYGMEGLAQGITEAAMQGSGLNAQDPNQLMVMGGAPTAGGGTLQTLRFLGGKALHLLPGMDKGARTALTPEARLLAQNVLETPASSKELYNQLATQSGSKARLTEFPELEAFARNEKQELKNVSLEQLEEDLKQAGLGKLVDDILSIRAGRPAVHATRPPIVSGKPATGTGLPGYKEVVKEAVPPGMTFANAQANIEGMGKMIAKTSDDEKRGVYKQFYSRFLTDMENMEAPTGVPVDLWKKARQAYKTEKSRMMLLDAIEANAPFKGGAPQLNADGVLTWMKNNKDFLARFSTAEEKAQLKVLQDNFTEMAKLAGNNPQRFSGMLAGMAITHSAGGALAGYAAADVMSKALMTEEGSQLALKILRKSAPSEWYGRAGSALATIAAPVLGSEGPSDPFKDKKVYGTLPAGEVRTEPKTFEPSAPVPTIPLTPDEIKQRVNIKAKEVGLPKEIANTLVKLESNYNPQATSKVGAIGLTQLMPSTAQGLGLSNPRDVDQNLSGGFGFFKKLLNKYDGDPIRAAQAYHQGPASVDRGDPPGPQTQEYVAKWGLELGRQKRDQKRR